MTSLETILPLLQKHDWFIVIDLTYAYFHITIRHVHHKFLRFTLQNSIYQFKSLLFGLSTAPRVFMKCMAPVVAHLRLQGITIFPYLDNWLLVAPSRDQVLKGTHTTHSLPTDLGLQINTEKSKLTPAQVTSYIGATLDSTVGSAFLPEDRQLKIASAVCHFLPLCWITAHKAQQLLGLMASTTTTVQHARLKMHPLSKLGFSQASTLSRITQGNFYRCPWHWPPNYPGGQLGTI